MKAVILAGGLGTRLSEETSLKPKPMVEIGNYPILWHIMKIYSSHGINEFIICCGYKGHVIKEYFKNYLLGSSDVTFDFTTDTYQIHDHKAEPWKITLVDTGEQTLTGGRLKRIQDYVKDEEEFCFTYGDGVSDVNITKLIEFHRLHGKSATLTATRPQGRFGAIDIATDGVINSFNEKNDGEGAWINGGFFVLKPCVIDRIESDNTTWELEPLSGLAADGQLMAFKHGGFWQPMDTLYEKNYLNKLWISGEAPWKTWD
jgi:glucose-1-phosphate cytidylyltransferase